MKRSWRFGVFEVDARNGEVRRGGTPVRMREQSFRILVYLLEHAGEMVTREELRRVLWPSDTFVDFDHSLNTAVMKLRDALGDSADAPLYIETIPKRGYRFIAPISVPAKTETASANADDNAALPEGSAAAAASPSDPSLAAKDRPARRRGVHWLLAGWALAALLLLVWMISRRHSPGTPETQESTPASASRTHSSELISVRGSVSVPELSPDAKEIAFVWDGERLGGELYVQLIRSDRGDEKPLRLTHTSSGFLCCANWSPDGRELAYGYCGDNGGGVFTVSALGGPPRRITDVSCRYGVGGWPVWAPDGNSLIIIDRCAPNTAPTLMRLSLASGEKHCIGQPLAGLVGDYDPALSPDGKTLAFMRNSDIYTLTLNTGKIHRLTEEDKAIWAFMWTPDSQNIVFRSSRGGLSGVWRISASGGTVERETVYPQVGTLSADGRRLVYLTNQGATSYFPITGMPTTIMRADLSAAGGHVIGLKDVITSDSLNDCPQLSPDETQIVFASNPANSAGFGEEIWKSNIDGSDAMQMTPAEQHGGTPRWSPDGKAIAFDAHPGSHPQIFIMDSDGRNQRMLIGDDADNATPSWSHDGRFLYYASSRTGSYQVWKREIATNTDTQITHQGGLGPLESYDGKALYYSKLDGAGVWAVSTEGGDEIRLIDPPHSGYWGYFAVTESGIYVLDTEYKPRPTFLFYDFKSHKLSPILPMPKNPIVQEPGLAASRDGKILLIAQEDEANSITLVEYP
jgi:Tol biopolymer transport system component/DNA-binding winged helix-turn-helix (wHTH) protein